MVGVGTPYFVVLPDQESAATSAGRLPPGVAQVITHRSGRPWVAGRLAGQHIVQAEHGDTRLVVIGQCSVTEAELGAAAARVQDQHQLDRLGTAWAGSFHLIALAGGRLHIQGSASGLRRVFHGRLGGLTFAADRADVLAALLDAPFDRAALALSLLPAVPHPLTDRTPWSNVSAVPPGSRLTLSPDGRRQTMARWWQAPEPVLSLEAGAARLRRALEAAVRVRTDGGRTVTTDLSGGLDSTSLTLLIARERASLTAFTMENPDRADEDLRWARTAAAHLPQLNHIVYPAHELPGHLGGLVGADGVPLPLDALPDEPSSAVLGAPRLRAATERATAHGSQLHVDGFGGDQLLTGHPGYEHDLLRSRPLLAVRRLRVLREITGFPVGPALRDLLDGRSYRHWLTAQSTALAQGRPPAAGRSVFGWGGSAQPPRWLTAEARQLITRTLRRTAAAARPLAPARGRHGDLLEIQNAGRTIRRLHQMMAAPGFAPASPFLDDQVIHACLAVRPEERITPWEFKPLIKAALADVMPPELLTRRTKGDGGQITAEGFEEHRRDIAAVWDSSVLAGLGLVDPDPLRDLFRRPYSPRHHDGALSVTFGCEFWLRAARPAAAAIRD
ncbi:asparagine synthase-related protein [Streptomyces orinoci]|uniref:asparagine synthase (glutamine-hydrolyzing) n=1 Tax=Streptomyces orinoci TaxID=67339 RepID=A0ABV3JWM7_STRON|nr:asparagine synthase-related protein [Streptomyces orinoci]